MNPFEMVIGIVLITSIASVIRAKYGVVRKGRGRHAEDVYVGTPHDDGEAERLRGDVRLLKERIQTLEAIVTDSNRSQALEQEIEQLRVSREARRQEIQP